MAVITQGAHVLGDGGVVGLKSGQGSKGRVNARSHVVSERQTVRQSGQVLSVLVLDFATPRSFELAVPLVELVRTVQYRVLPLACIRETCH